MDISDWVYYLFCLPVLFATRCIAKKLHFDTKTIDLMLIAVVLYYFSFYSSTADDFTVDASYHINYITFLAKDYLRNNIAVYVNSVGGLPSLTLYQLPFYYTFAAAFYWFGDVIGMRDPVSMARHFSMLCYLGFIFFSILTLRRVIHDSSRAYYPALALLLFWPIGIALGGCTHPEIAAYCAQMGVIYYLVVWVQNGRSASLANAFIFCGLALLIKSTGLMYLVMAMLCAFWFLYQNRQTIRTIITPRLIASMLFAAGAYLFSVFHYPLTPFTIPSPPLDFWGYFELFTTFHPYAFLWDNMDATYIEGQKYYWHFFLHTLIIGTPIPFYWKPVAVTLAIRAIFLAMLLYIIAGFIGAIRRKWSVEEKRLGLLFLILSGILMGAEFYIRYKRPEEFQASSARYIFPIMPILVIAYAKVMQWHDEAGRELIYRIGNGLVLGTVLLSISLYVAQHILLQ